MYDEGRGVKKNYKEAFKWYQKAAMQGDADAQCNLGYKYEYGEGVGKNMEEAFKWYHRAAMQGQTNAQFSTGLMYTFGDGVSEDDVKAYMWFSLAAEAGFKPASIARFTLSILMSSEEIEEAERMAEAWEPVYEQ